METVEWVLNGTTIAQCGCWWFLPWRLLGGGIFCQIFQQPGCVRVLGAAHTAMVLWWSFGGAGFIGADDMVRGHFLLSFRDSYVVNVLSYLVVVVASLCKL